MLETTGSNLTDDGEPQREPVGYVEFDLFTMLGSRVSSLAASYARRGSSR